jgi:hypothetical protein
MILVVAPIAMIFAGVPGLMKAYKTNRLPGRRTEYDRFERPVMFWGGVVFIIVMIVFSIVSCVTFLPAHLASLPNSGSGM